jgi:hypothetical protein
MGADTGQAAVLFLWKTGSAGVRPESLGDEFAAASGPNFVASKARFL